MKTDLRIIALAAACGWCWSQAALADDHNHAADETAAAAEPEAHDHHAHGDEPHEHTAPESNTGYEISFASYDIPKITLRDQYDRPVRVDKLLAEDRPTLVQFIFTSCSTICPIMGAVFGGAQDQIAAIAPNYRMISVSIDPEYDTPDKLREFAAKQNANRDWVFLTGADADVKEVVKAFDALYQGDNKMYHQPYTFIRWREDGEWVRIRGLMGVSDLAAEFAKAGA